MKSLKDIITEKLRINKDTHFDIHDYNPNKPDELYALIEYWIENNVNEKFNITTDKGDNRNIYYDIKIDNCSQEKLFKISNDICKYFKDKFNFDFMAFLDEATNIIIGFKN